MVIPETKLMALLARSRKLSKQVLEESQKKAEEQKKPLQAVLFDDNLITPEDLSKLYAKDIGIEFVEFDPTELTAEMLSKIPDRTANKYRVVVFGEDKGRLKLAMEDPGDLQAVDVLEKLLGKNIEFYASTEENIGRALGKYRGSLDTEITKVFPDEMETEPEGPTDQEVSAEDVAEDSPVAKTVNILIDYAMTEGASDIHIEPREDSVKIRYRIDGMLREANTLPRSILAAVVSRIKIMSNLKIDEHRVPQDGRFKVEKNSKRMALRVSTLPTMDGEKVVMRLLDESSQAIGLDDLGYNSSALQRVQRAISQPNGIMLVTGPTGSGKSTSLYSMLTILNTPTVNISTVEDPVEYRIEGVNQTQVNPKAGMTFANGLRALLRQDPNIIMVGEIRDSETADLAIQAALTGHLVLSTLHTNDAATALPRLLDMGMEPFLIASTVRAIVGQRLVRKLCTDCKVEYRPTLDEMQQISKEFQTMTALERLRKQGLLDVKGDLAKYAAKLKFFKAGKGCSTCGHATYKGRIGIYEVLESDPSVQQLIVSHSTSDQLKQKAMGNGMITMHEDGLLKAILGLTTIEEILRVTQE